MKRHNRWNRYYNAQMADPVTRSLIEEELKALRVGVQIAKRRQERGLTQTQLAAKVGMSAPNISRLESNPAQNVTLQTLLKVCRALDQDVTISLKKRSSSRRT